MARQAYTPLDPMRLSRAVVIWIYIRAATSAAQVIACGYVMADPRGGAIAVALGASVFLVVYLISGFLGLKWIYRVNRNACAFASDIPTSPPWSVGWFFVPVASLWKPYAAICDAWQASERPERWKTAPRPKFLGWWWAAWLAAGFSGNAVSVVSRYTDDLATVAPFGIIAAVASIAASLLFAHLVKRLSSLQSAQITFGSFGDAPPRTEQPAVFALAQA